MVTFLFDVSELVLVEWMPKGTTINAARYVSTGVLQPRRYLPGDARDELNSYTRYHVEQNT